MTRQERVQEFDNKADGSVELGRDVIQSMLKWTEYIAESEFSVKDQKRLLNAYRALYLVVQPMNERYIDGEVPA